jgi:hypothetical protein
VDKIFRHPLLLKVCLVFFFDAITHLFLDLCVHTPRTLRRRRPFRRGVSSTPSIVRTADTQRHMHFNGCCLHLCYPGMPKASSLL